MKTSLMIASVLALSGLAFSVQAENGKGKKKHPHRPIAAAVVEKFDKDGDGKLDEGEREAAREAINERRAAMKERMLAEFDKDGDGKLNETEREAAREAMKERREANKPEAAE